MDDMFSLFPPEIWLEIGKRITDVKDLQTFSRVSPSFEELFRELITERLLSKALPLVIKSIQSSGENEDLLSMRLVSRKWKKSVDLALVDGEPLDAYVFHEPKTISDFLEHFSGHPGNPILGCSVNFSYNPFSTPAETFHFEQLAMQMMDAYGTHVKRLVFGGTPRRLPQPNGVIDVELDVVFLRRLQTLIRRAPNLESLFIIALQRYPGRGRELEDLVNAQMQPFPPYLPEGPHPLIQGLRLLVIIGMLPEVFDEQMQLAIYRMAASPTTFVRSNRFREIAFSADAAEAMRLARGS